VSFVVPNCRQAGRNTTRGDRADFEVACYERLLGEDRSNERPKFREVAQIYRGAV
jgi:hypothetical protein